MRSLSLLAATLVPAALLTTAAPAAHGETSPDPLQSFKRVHLTIDAQGLMFGDTNDLVYNVTIANSGPDDASGITLQATARSCYSKEAVRDECDVTGVRTFTVADIPAGGSLSFPYEHWLSNDQAVDTRTTLRIVHTDQMNTSQVGGCTKRSGDKTESCVILLSEFGA